jgi:hypothetical protein
MARRGRSNDGINRSELIRQKKATLGRGARPRDIIASLAEDGVKVSRALVTNVLKRRGTGKKRGRKRARVVARRSASREAISMTGLLTAKRMVDEMGSVADAKKALDAFARLI